MHLKAIEIKEKLLGDEDYEVGLSVGHLASLYNYHMKEYKKAELLYFRSIRISKHPKIIFWFALKKKRSNPHQV